MMYCVVIIGLMCISYSYCTFTSENVVFQKTNEIYINDAHWYVTFVHDLRPYNKLIDQIKSDLHNTDNIIKTIINNYKRFDETGYAETFESLRVEVDLLSDTYKSVYDQFDEYKIFSPSNQRNKRSLLPVVGQLMSSLFGTVSEDDLENINRNIKNLAENQEQIIHDLDMSLSILNLTTIQVAENRRSIMDLIVVVQKLDSKILQLGEAFQQKFVKLEQFIHTYLQFKMILDEIRLTTQNAVIYLENLKSELNMLSMLHLSTSTISPRNLRSLLVEIKSKLPNNFELPRSPTTDIWYYYKTLTCVTYMEDNEIRIVLKIPLINTKEQYEVYKVHNIPLPLYSISKNETSHPYLVKYELETEEVLVSKDRTKFSLLSENSYHVCNSDHMQFCDPETAFYQTNLNKLCVMALFMQARDDIKQLCKQTVILNQKLPMTKYLSSGIWIVMTNTDLKFTVSCQSNIAEPSDIKVKPPFGIVTLNNTCKASNKYLQLSEYFDKHSMFERSDPLQSLLKLRNISQFTIWQESKANFEKLPTIKLPSRLTDLKEIPMQGFLREMHAYKKINFENKQTWTFATTVVVVVSIIVFIVTVACIIKRFSHINCKRLANLHDHVITCTKRPPSNVDGEDIEMMSVTRESGNVNNILEGQSKPLRQMDATMAWVKNDRN